MKAWSTVTVSVDLLLSHLAGFEKRAPFVILGRAQTK